MIAEGKLSLDVAVVMGNVYQRMGCEIAIKSLPGRRGILHFNQMRVDGELLRIDKAEASYQRAFV